MNTSDDQELDGTLNRLALATSTIRPSANFNQRVMAALPLNVEVAWPLQLWSTARHLVPIGALLAVVGLVWAAQTSTAIDDAVASTDTIELLW